MSITKERVATFNYFCVLIVGNAVPSKFNAVNWQSRTWPKTEEGKRLEEEQQQIMKHVNLITVLTTDLS